LLGLPWICVTAFLKQKKSISIFFSGLVGGALLGGAKREKTAHMDTAHRAKKSDTAGRTFLNPEAERMAATPRQIHHTSASGH